MRVALYALHYGKEYLAWSIRALQQVVDEVHVFYSPVPSFGTRSPVQCPESEADLRADASAWCKKPLFWHNVFASSEGQHRDMMLEAALARGATTCIVSDADEVWDPASARAAMDAVEAANSSRRWLARFTNFWKSFDWTVSDDFRPVRIFDLRHGGGDAYLTEQQQPFPVLHFGYAQSMTTMRYKWTCHGHQSELRDGWLSRYENWKPGEGDLHPVCINLWNALPTDEATRAKLDELLGDHPYRQTGAV